MITDRKIHTNRKIHLTKKDTSDKERYIWQRKIQIYKENQRLTCRKNRRLERHTERDTEKDRNREKERDLLKVLVPTLTWRKTDEQTMPKKIKVLGEQMFLISRNAERTK